MESARKVVLMILIAHSPIANVLEADVGMTKDLIKTFYLYLGSFNLGSVSARSAVIHLIYTTIFVTIMCRNYE